VAGRLTTRFHTVVDACRLGPAQPGYGSPRGARAGDRENKEDIVAEKTQTYNGYCVKCKEKRDFEGSVEVSKTGMRMAKGKCPVCGTTVNRILGKA
jgi:hypothetical protein